MTTRIDFDQRVATWLERAGPAGIADDVVDAAFIEADSIGQRRAPWPVGPSRWPGRSIERIPMRVVVVTALVALSIGAALVVAGGSRDESLVVTPIVSPSPTAAESTAAPAVAFPDALRGSWLATQPDGISFGTPSGPSTMRLGIGPRTAAVTADNLAGYRILRSTPGPVGSGAQVVTLVADAPGGLEHVWVDREGPSACAAGDAGTYEWVIRRSDGADIAAEIGDLLELRLVDDACRARAAVLSRTWVRSLAAPGNGGMGVIPVSSMFVRAVLPPGTYQGDVSESGGEARSIDRTVSLGVMADPHLPLFSCAPITDPGKPVFDVESYLAALAGDPVFVVEETRSMSIGGRSGTAVVLRPRSEPGCPDRSAGTDGDPNTPDRVPLYGGAALPPFAGSITIYVVSVPEHLIGMMIEAPDEPTRHAILGSIGFVDALDELVANP